MSTRVGAIERLAAVLRRLARLPVLRALRRTRWAHELADAISYGKLVEESLRFTASQLARRPMVATYRPRGARLDLVVRHGTSDRYILAEVFEHDLYRIPAEVSKRMHALGRPPVIVDLGAHVGAFGVYALTHFPEAQLVAYEPDPANADILERCVASNDAGDRWRVVRASAGVSDGVDLLAAGRFAESQVVEQGLGLLEVPRKDVFADLWRADLIKIDIEGSEWPILTDMRFEELGALGLALEYHPQQCPFADPRSGAVGRFRDLGYEVEEIEVPFAPPGVGMLWAWRPDRVPRDDSATSPNSSA